jgi:hypothetical protein
VYIHIQLEWNSTYQTAHPEVGARRSMLVNWHQDARLVVVHERRQSPKHVCRVSAFFT